MAEREPEFIVSDVTQDDYESASSGFVTIPPKNPKIGLQAGDSVMLEIATGKGEWKQPGVSLVVPVTVTQKGENEGKTAEIYPGVGKTALSILKNVCQSLGVEDKVITFNDRHQMVIRPHGFEGGKGVGVFVATWTVPQEAGKNPSLVAKLATTQIFPIGYGKSTGGTGKSIGI